MSGWEFGCVIYGGGRSGGFGQGGTGSGVEGWKEEDEVVRPRFLDASCNCLSSPSEARMLSRDDEARLPTKTVAQSRLMNGDLRVLSL